jgi:hypothetical protein
MDIDYTPAGWAKNIALITKLGAENELLQLKLDDALAQLRLYRVELRNAEMIRHQIMNELAEMRYGRRSPAVIIPIREVVG